MTFQVSRRVRTWTRVLARSHFCWCNQQLQSISCNCIEEQFCTTLGNGYYVPVETCTCPAICCRGTHYHVRPTQNVENTIACEPLLVAINLTIKNSIFNGSKSPAKEAIASFGAKGSNFKGSNFKGSNFKGSNFKGSNSQNPHFSLPPPPLQKERYKKLSNNQRTLLYIVPGTVATTNYDNWDYEKRDNATHCTQAQES
jgi:hypothetical protein